MQSVKDFNLFFDVHNVMKLVHVLINILQEAQSTSATCRTLATTINFII